jgi:hypothetical protein
VGRAAGNHRPRFRSGARLGWLAWWWRRWSLFTTVVSG